MAMWKTLWGLLVDDGRLASILVICVILAGVCARVAHLPTLGTVFIWGGLLLALVVSVEHQLNLKIKK